MENNTTKQKWEKYFSGGLVDLPTPNWHGDIDFRYDSGDRVILGEIKTVKENYWSRNQLPLDMEQAKQYGSMSGLVDNYGRTIEVYLFEEHVFSDTEKSDYVIVVPFKKPTGNEKETIDFLDYDNAKCLYTQGKQKNGFTQIINWFCGMNIGIKPKHPLMCLA
jgi:hypothetical protein